MSQTNDITALRDALFATLAGLQDKESPMDIERARAINETGQVIINSVKAEADYLKALGNNKGSGFIATPALPAPTAPALKAASEFGSSNTANGTKTIEPIPGGTLTTHKLR